MAGFDGERLIQTVKQAVPAPMLLPQAVEDISPIMLANRAALEAIGVLWQRSTPSDPESVGPFQRPDHSPDTSRSR